MEDVEKAISFDNPKNPAFLDTRGYIYFLRGNYDQALKDLNLAIECAEADRQRVEKFAPKRAATSGCWLALSSSTKKPWPCSTTIAVRFTKSWATRPTAKSDLNRGDQLGYNPTEGVF